MVNALPLAPTIIADGPTAFCAGGSVTLTSGTGTSYLWSTGATAASINVITAGSYSVRVTDANGCQSIVSAASNVTVNALPVAPTITAGGPTTFCAGSSVTLTSSAGISYLWSTDATKQGINVTTAGSYAVRVTDANGCQSAASAVTIVTLINVLPVAVAGTDQELKFIFETQMEAVLSSPETGAWSVISGSGNIWDIRSSTSRVTELSIGENKFLWTVHNGSCDATDEVKITVYDLFVPSVITPNGDGKNDYFQISALVGHVELIIFNRWGNEEYSNGNYLNNWDGRNNKGAELPDDTYFYILKLGNGITRKGTVLITR